MGITLRELMELDFFRDFEVIAGKQGMNREVQGVAAMEAPDAFRWAVGKELVISSGYVLQQDPDAIRRGYKEGNLQKGAGFMLKMERYVKELPQDILQLFDDSNMPLIKMPDSIPWMELITQITTAVMNRTIQGLEIYTEPGRNIIDKSYKERKIRQVLSMLEKDMGFPAMLYDIDEERAYYSSDQFPEVSEHYELQVRDYWMPEREHQEISLCEYIHMARIRLTETEEENKRPVSWIKIPIMVEGTTRAHFIVMESRELLDYYDEVSIRMAFLMLHSMYEQINAVRVAGNIGFENFIHFVLNYRDSDQSKLIYQAGVQGVSLNTRYIMALMQVKGSNLQLRGDRSLLMEGFRKCRISRCARLVILDMTEAIILLEPGEERNYTFAYVEGLLEEFERTLKKKIPEAEICFGVSMEAHSIKDLRESMEKCTHVLRQGHYILPEKRIWDYESLGPLAWLQIPEKELEKMLGTFRELGNSEKNNELLRTLKIYLENNMNYSVTAEKMYVHINTIRKRVEKLNDLLQINWEDPVERLKLEILLQYMQL